MSFKEKMAWVSALVSVVVGAVYFGVVGARLDDGPVSEVDYKWWMIGAIGATIVASIIGAIVMAVATAIRAEITGEGSVKDIDREDERDVGIDRRGELIGYYVSSVGVLAALVLAMWHQDQFWIANALYLFLLIGSVVSSVAKIVLYRRGF
jgi:MFS family permease